tara:strand:- start:93 stop:221 length:129 start_codon:yes stop_codon:yes gene_type:complete
MYLEINMEKSTEIISIFGFILSIGLFAYGIKKIFIRMENSQK